MTADFVLRDLCCTTCEAVTHISLYGTEHDNSIETLALHAQQEGWFINPKWNLAWCPGCRPPATFGV